MNYVIGDSKSAFVTTKNPKTITASSKKAIEVDNFIKNHSFVVSSKEGSNIKIKIIKK